MSKHTPGPWSVGRHIGSRSDVRLIHKDAGDKGRGIPIIEVVVSIDDARLIAAAPDLLESLQSVVSWMDAPDESAFSDSALSKARAAIAKATGEQE